MANDERVNIALRTSDEVSEEKVRGARGKSSGVDRFYI